MKTDLLTRKIRTILIADWDPLGVGENQNLADEYDKYIPEIRQLLRADSDCAPEIAKVLHRIEREEMGLNRSLNDVLIAATKLTSISVR